MPVGAGISAFEQALAGHFFGLRQVHHFQQGRADIGKLFGTGFF
jgi:hypothetical protein